MRVELEPFGVVVRWPGTGLALLVDVTGGAVWTLHGGWLGVAPLWRA